MTARQIDEQVDAFLVANGAKLRVNDAAREHGQIIAFNNRTYDLAKAVPTVVMRNEDYGRISRILADGTPVELEFNIVNKVYPEGRTAYNTIAEIPGTDKKDEVVMLGGHLDSWHSATGATDNAIGCATMMEAARILKAIGVTPRRTIRVALWSGEEEGHPRIAGLREGALRHRSRTRSSRSTRSWSPTSTSTPAPAARAAPACSVRRRRRPSCARRWRRSRISASPARRRPPAATIAGTDSTAFNNVGLPGIGFSQDPIEYNTHTHHTNLDNYERVIEDDVKASAIAIAATLYQLAMRDEMLPRLPAAQMPPLPAPPSVKFPELAYIEWAKSLPPVEVNLARSGVALCPSSLLGLTASDLVATLPVKYGYAPLRDAIAARYDARRDQVFAVSGGTSYANWLACLAVLDGCSQGTEVIVERPTYEPLLKIPRTLGYRVRRLDRRFEDGYAIDLDRFASLVTTKTRLAIVTNLHNPSGVRDPDGDAACDGHDARAREGVPAGRRGLPRVPVPEPGRIVRARGAERGDDQQPHEGLRTRRPSRRLDPRARRR